jgi:hypothetical protein
MLSSSSTEESVNLLASDDETIKKKERSQQKRLLTIPVQIDIQQNLPPRIVDDADSPQSSNGDNVTINLLLEEELQERDTKRKRDEESSRS